MATVFSTTVNTQTLLKHAVKHSRIILCCCNCWYWSQIRLFDGQTLTQKFSVNEPLAAVRLFVHGKLTDTQLAGDVFGLTFATAYPRKVYSEDDMMTPLGQLGNYFARHDSVGFFILLN